MANLKSSKKMIRKISKRTLVNGSRRSRMRSHVRAVEEALTAGDGAKAREALKSAEPEIMRTASKGVIHKRAASRKVSRLAQRVKSLGA